MNKIFFLMVAMAAAVFASEDLMLLAALMDTLPNTISAGLGHGLNNNSPGAILLVIALMILFTLLMFILIKFIISVAEIKTTRLPIFYKSQYLTLNGYSIIVAIIIFTGSAMTFGDHKPIA